MSTPDQQTAAMRFMEMAVDPKKLGKTREAFKSAHKVDLMEAYRDAQRAVKAQS